MGTIRGETDADQAVATCLGIEGVKIRSDGQVKAGRQVVFVNAQLRASFLKGEVVILYRRSSNRVTCVFLSSEFRQPVKPRRLKGTKGD